MKKHIVLCMFYRFNPGLELWTQVRQSHDELNSLAEFPGGKVEPNEAPSEAVKREVLEEVGLKGIDPKRLIIINDDERDLVFHVFIHPSVLGLAENGWYLAQDLLNPDKYLSQIPPFNQRIIEVLTTSLYDMGHE